MDERWICAAGARLRGKQKPRKLLVFRGFAVVAGAGYPQCYTAPETYWVELT